tara:strand:+ start:1352 stop:1837 length:486 start_codon:yes stop_codon:yes gene_type:complete
MTSLFNHVRTFGLPSELSREINEDMTSRGHGVNVAQLDLSQKIANYCFEQIDKAYEGAMFTSTNQIMYLEHPVGSSTEAHWDKIYDIFDGNIRGVPILSIIGVTELAEKGGKFFITTPDGEKREYLSKENTVVVFPSTFLYRHEMSEVIKGTRRSFFTWGY